MWDTASLQRAFAAYYLDAARRQREEGVSVEQPDSAASYEAQLDGKAYVVLRKRYQTLAVYRIKPNGLLRRLKRWPKALDPEAA
jgi:hypothetical protein